jgi:hypothetical protein
LLLRNSAALVVDNGDRGTITAVEPKSRWLTVGLDAGRQVRLPDWYLDAGWIDYGYALTAHRLQSTTVDRTFALATDDLYQQAGYSIATRARHETHFYLAAQDDLADREHAHGPPQPPEDAIGRFARHLGLSRAQSLASDEPARARGRILSTAELHDEHDRVRQELNAFPARQARTLETLGDEADRQREELSDVGLRIGQTNHRIDALGFFKRHGTEGEDLRRQAEQLESQHAYAERQHVETVEAIAAHRADNDPVAWVDHHAEQIRYLRALEDELSARDRNAERQLVVAAQIDPPDHITAVLGPRPESYINRPAWERAVAAIETYRHRHGIAPDHSASALGPASDRTHPNPDFRDAERAIHQARAQLDLEPDTPRPQRETPIERLSEPPQHGLSIGRDTGLSIDL